MNVLEFDIAIVGGGCMGASIFYELTRRGSAGVGLVDEGRKTVSATAHSGGMSRVFHESAEHVSLALANEALLQARQREGVFRGISEANGSLYFFNRRRYADYQGHLKRMDEADYPFEIFTPANGRRHFPQFHWGDDEWAIYEPRGGHRSPREFTEDLLSASVRHGGTLIDGFQVRRLSHCRDHYRISGGEATVVARTLILAGGARLVPRLRDLGLSLPLETRSLSTVVANKVRGGPNLPNYFDRETLEFARLGFGPQVILSHRKPLRLVDPLWRGPWEERTADDCYAPHRIGFSGEVSGFPQLMIATGWGGTGFKFALEIGRRVAMSVERDRAGGREATL